MYIRQPFSYGEELSHHDCTLSHLQQRIPICHLDSKIDFLINWAFVRAREPQIFLAGFSAHVPVCTHFPSCLKLSSAEPGGVRNSVKTHIETSGCFQKGVHQHGQRKENLGGERLWTGLSSHVDEICLRQLPPPGSALLQLGLPTQMAVGGRLSAL